ncbi:hypothetical protein ABT033_22445 [Streptomyces pharetrae]|uniref:hypothetical protein n=1 Tax=Streptomyces TaxID=1883 RepID=UPI0033499B3B
MARNLLATDAGTRERAAGEITDRLNAYSAGQASALATLLAAAAAVETEHSALEAQLHAILELASTGHVTVGHVAQLREIDPGKLPPELAAYVVDLLEG